MVTVNNKVKVIELLEPDFFGFTLNHNVVVSKNAPGGGLLLIDTSLPENLDELERRLKAWGYSIEDVSDVVVTHFHPDHYGNAEEIRRRAKAKVYAHYLEDVVEGEITYSQAKEEFNVSEEDFERTVKRISAYKLPKPTVDVSLRGGERIGDFQVIHTPGHTKGHVVLFDGQVLVTGDAVRNYNGLRPPVKFFCWDYQKAVEQFHFLLNLPYRFLIPYHGEVVTKC
ncbi:MAG: MBL fold metallo-hydrolase [Candidatus Aramenus sp.]|jgi:glyoxylase-like metal-dependent hydrolase (beta-lactamase superfamily II)|nr:MBL fold metallo-hydrolase [Candidatus Aramenus sp.]